MSVKNGKIVPKLEDGRELTRIIIVERYPKNANKRIFYNGFVTNMKVANGAMSVIAKTTEGWFVSTIGSNDDDMFASMMAADKLSGGYAVVQGGQTLGTFNLPIYSMMTDASPGAAVPHKRPVFCETRKRK